MHEHSASHVRFVLSYTVILLHTGRKMAFNPLACVNPEPLPCCCVPCEHCSGVGESKVLEVPREHKENVEAQVLSFLSWCLLLVRHVNDGLALSPAGKMLRPSFAFHMTWGVSQACCGQTQTQPCLVVSGCGGNLAVSPSSLWPDFTVTGRAR